MDSEDKSRALADQLGLSFPIAYGMDVKQISRLTGGFYDNDKNYLQPTGIIVRPDKSIEIAVYSTGAVGRFTAQDALGVIKFYQSQ